MTTQNTYIKAPKAILFDWDNTLIDSWEIIHHALNETFLKFGMDPWSLEEVRQKAHLSTREAFPILFEDQWQEAVKYFYTVVEAIHINHLNVLEGAKDLLDHLKTTGIPLGIVSNKKGDILRREVSHLGWDSFFGPIIGAGDAEKDKPHPAPILKALDFMALPVSEEIWVVGDSPADWEAAIASGCRPIVIGNLRDDRPSGQISVTNCQELQKILGQF